MRKQTIAGCGSVTSAFSPFKLAFALLATGFLALYAGQINAATTTLDTLLDTDNNAATGCGVVSGATTVTGVETILRTIIVADASGYRTQSVSMLRCSGASFAAPSVIDNVPRTIARGNGVSGSTAVEIAIPSLFFQAGGPPMRAAFISTGSDGLNGGDVLVDAGGGPILVAAPPVIVVPTLGIFWLVVLVAFVIGAVALARRRGYSSVQLVLVGIVATALSGQIIAAIVRDGFILDWSAVTASATDPTGDAPAGTDILAVYSQTDSLEVAFRVDMVLNATPAANAQSLTAVAGVALPITLTGSDLEGAALTFTVVGNPSNGTIGGTAPNLTYTANATYGGPDSFTFRVNDGGLDSALATIALDVRLPPTITSANTATFIPGQANSFTVTANAVPAATFALTACTPALPGSVTLTNNGGNSATLAGNPTTAQAGSYSCTLTASNGFGANAAQPFTLIIGGPPTITSAAALVNATEQVSYTHSLTATSLVAFPITALAQTGTAPAGLALGAPVGLGTNAANAPFTGTPAVCSRGNYSFAFTATNSQGTATQNVTLTVLGVNQAPSFTAPSANQTVGEDAGAQTVANWAQTISAGPACESTQTINFVTTVTANAALFATAPAVDATGTLTYTPVANASGVANVSVQILDNGGTANGGNPNGNTVDFTITVNDVNDAPSFTKGADQTVLEDSGAQTAVGWASAISAGPANESGQTLTFNATNNNNALFSVQPAIAANGTLTYTPAANAFGTATVSVSLQDNGGTANGGVDTSPIQTFAINVTAVNDAPSFTVGLNQTVLEDAGAQTVNPWATAISAGPNEAAQTVSFEITNNTNPTLFAAGPAVSATGALTYTPATNANGAATITLRVRDNGGTANGGIDASATQSFTITVTAVNDAPSFTSGGNVTVLRNSGAYGPTNWATAISTGPADESAQTLSFTITGNTNTALFLVAPTINALGQLAFTPATNQFGIAQITVQAQDNGGVTNGGQDTSASVVFTIAVQSAPTITSPASAVFPLNTASSFTITTTGLPDVNNITLTASPGPGVCVLPAGITFSYVSGTTATLSGTATSSTAVNCVVTASNGINPAATQVLSIIPGVAPTAEDDAFILLRGTATPAGTLFVANANPTTPDDLGTPAATVASFGGGSFGGTVIDNPTTAVVTPVAIPGSGGITVSLLQNGQLDIDATAGTAISGVYSFDYRLSNSAGTSDATVTITVGTTPTISGLPSATAIRGTPYSHTFTLGGFPTPTVAVSGCTLPSGITSSAAGSLSGTPSPTAVSASNCTATATNVFGAANLGPWSITVAAAAPVLTAGGSASYTEGNPPVDVDTTVTVSDFDSTTLASATVTLTTGFVAAQDSLSFTNVAGMGNITGSYASGVLTLTSAGATATLAQWQTALRAVKYANSSNAPSGSRTVSWVANDGALASTAVTSTINLIGINSAPSFTKGADQTVNEDAGAQTVNPWATAISDGDGGGQTLAFSITGNTNPALFGAGPAISAAGVLTYTPAANANGTATITVTLSDNGSNVSPNVNISAAQTFVITVNAVNDAPSFTKGADQTVNEDAGAQTVNPWASAISAGPADESAQTLSFNITGNTNVALFSAGPAISPTGVLTYTPAVNANGSATITVTLSDSGSNVAPNVNTSAAQTFVISVNGVNDAPNFTAGANQTVNEDAGAQTVNPWATGISAGPANESSQTVSFNITGNTNPGLFSAGPAISPTGVLTYTPAANQNGSASITVTLSDSGGTANGGVDTSASQSFTITVNAVNDPPVAQTKNGGSVQANMRRVGIDASLLTGVTDVDNGINGCVSTTFTVASITSGTNGTVANVNLAAGTFDFDPAPGFTGTATVNYTVSDTGCPGPAATSAAATINLTVVGPVIWFLDPAAGTNGDGRLGTPFNSLASANVAKGANVNNRIFVYTGTTAATVGVSLAGDTTQPGAQWLIGQGATGASFDALMGIAPPAGTVARPAIGGTRPTIQGTLTLNGSNVKAQGFNLSTGTNTGVNDAVGAIAGVALSEISVTSTSGTAVSLSDIDGSVSLTAVSSNAAANGITIQNSTGSFVVTGSSSGNCGGGVSSPTPPATVVAPVTADCTGGSILSSTGPGVSLINASNVSLTRMRIANGADDGIRGDRVNGFTLASSLVESNGAVGSGNLFNNLDFGQDFTGGQAVGQFVGLTGTVSITNSTIRNGALRNVLVRSNNASGTSTMNLTMTGSVIAGNADNASDDGILIESAGSTNMNATLTGNIFAANKGDHFQMAARNGGVGSLTGGNFNVVLRNNTMIGGHPSALGQGVTINAATGVAFGGYNGTGVYDVDGNVFNGAISNSVSVVLGTSASTASFVGKVRNNTIGTSGGSLSCSTQANGVYIDARGNATHTSAVTNNVIRQCFDRGILAEAGDGDSVLNLTVTGNTIDQQVDVNAREAIQTNFGITSTNVFGNVDTPVVCLQLGGAGALANTFSHGAGAPDDFRLRKRQEATVRLPGYAGGTDQTAGSLAQVVAFVRAQNTGSAGEPGSAAASGAGGGYTGGAACPLPP
jgi:large repetitive protein